MKTTAYETARLGRKSLIIGRKGSGKSAICMMLANDPTHNVAVSVVTPDEISGDEIRRFELTGIVREQSKALLWRYIFETRIAKFLIAEAVRSSVDVPKSIRNIRRFLVDNGEIEDLTFQEKFWRVIERIKGSLSMEAFGVRVNADLEPPSEGIRASSEIETLECNLKQGFIDLNCPADHGGLLLLVDQLEKIWSNDEESDAMLVGLLLASKHVASTFNHVRCVTFLRTDIYELLQFQDRDNFRGEEALIDWSPRDLLQLTLARARASVGDELMPTDFFGRMFPAVVDGEPVAEYLINRTLMRPRDIIQLCNACRDTAYKNGHDSIIEEDVREACTQYSNWKLLDLLGEYGINYPFLKDILVVFQNVNYLMTKQSIGERFDILRDNLVSRYRNFDHLFTLHSILNVLYSVGFLGVLRNGSTSYAYTDPKAVDPSDRDFVIHPCFREALRSTSAIGIQSFEPGLLAGVGTHVLSNVRFRARREYRSLGYILKVCLRLDDAVTESTLVADIKNEVHRNVQMVVRELQTYEVSGLLVDEQKLARKVTFFLQGVYLRLDILGFLADKRLRRAFEEPLDRLRSERLELRTESPE